MTQNWPLLAALALILLKQIYKLHLQHKPDRIDYLKAVAALPIDVSFLVVSLFVRQASQGGTDKIAALMILYLLVSVATTILWRICDGAVTSELGKSFFWAFPTNAALAGTTFYVALELLG